MNHALSENHIRYPPVRSLYSPAVWQVGCSTWTRCAGRYIGTIIHHSSVGLLRTVMTGAFILRTLDQNFCLLLKHNCRQCGVPDGKRLSSGPLGCYKVKLSLSLAQLSHSFSSNLLMTYLYIIILLKPPRIKFLAG